MANFKISEIVDATNGKLIQGQTNASVKGVSINSRTITRGNAFVAVKGSNFDGYRFVRSAINKGASALVISSKSNIPKTKIPVIAVDDTVLALGALAKFHRSRFKVPIIAVTGSAGKTTTKEYIAGVLGAEYKVLKSLSSENNQIGVPLTLLKLRKGFTAGVIEIGTNQKGEIAALAKIVNPDVVVLTNIGASHLEKLGTPAGVFREKFQSVKNMHPKGTVIVNNDDSFLSQISRAKAKRRVVKYGIKNQAAVRATQIKVTNHQNLQFKVGRNSYMISSLAHHNIYNALAAISCGRLFKIRYNDIYRSLARIKPPKGRAAIQRHKRYLIIDDTYNANPLSFDTAINTLININTNGRKILVCGDMLELGRKSRDYHESIGKKAADCNISLVLSYGRMAENIVKAARRRNGGLQAFQYKSLPLLHKKLKAYCRPGDVILVKASRGMRLERTLKFLATNLK